MIPTQIISGISNNASNENGMIYFIISIVIIFSIIFINILNTEDKKEIQKKEEEVEDFSKEEIEQMEKDFNDKINNYELKPNFNHIYDNNEVFSIFWTDKDLYVDGKKIDNHFHCNLEISEEDKKFKIENFNEKFIKPLTKKGE